MINIESGLLILWVIFSILFAARKTSQQRAKIKERVNREYDQKEELSTEEVRSRLSETQLMYEELEKTYWGSVGVLVAISTHMYWKIWYLSLVVGISIILVGNRYLSLKPFTLNTPDR